MAGERVGRAGGKEGREGMWRGPESGLPRGPRWLSAGLGTAHPSTASLPITVLLYNVPLFCGCTVPIKELNGNSKSSVGVV